MTGAAMCTPPSRSLFECFSLLWLLCYNSWTGHVFQHVCISLANARLSPHITLSSLCRGVRKDHRKWHQLVIMLLRQPAVRHWNLPQQWKCSKRHFIDCCCFPNDGLTDNTVDGRSCVIFCSESATCRRLLVVTRLLSHYSSPPLHRAQAVQVQTLSIYWLN